jgi:MFS family permease
VTAFQLVNGRLTGIFAHKNLLLVCLVLLAVGGLICGFIRAKEKLFAFRAIAGVGGGVNGIAMIRASDITTLENRGKFQGEQVHRKHLEAGKAARVLRHGQNGRAPSVRSDKD